MELNVLNGAWVNEPKNFNVSDNLVSIQTEPNTDFWQRSYYGFRNENAPAYLLTASSNFTFTTQCEFEYAARFDQAGIIIFIDNENWFKASIEFEKGELNRLGSVCTNNGYSDWATTDIKSVNNIWYRLSRRGADFLIEYSFDGTHFAQMRIFHLHALGETTPEMGKANPPLAVTQRIGFGFYACSPSDSSFEAKFSEFTFEECQWRAHE
jgi:regulation of enolase protein 1 (concanavalin A-like superfamily)